MDKEAGEREIRGLTWVRETCSEQGGHHEDKEKSCNDGDCDRNPLSEEWTAGKENTEVVRDEVGVVIVSVRLLISQLWSKRRSCRR